MLELARERNLPIEHMKSGFFKIGTGPKRIYVAESASGLARRVDLSGFVLNHPVVRRISREAAKTGHLGNVLGQIDFDKPPHQALEAICLALDEVAKFQPPAATAGSPANLPAHRSLGMTFEDFFEDKGLLEAIERQRLDMQQSVPKGVTVDFVAAIRVLLWEAIEQRERYSRLDENNIPVLE
jgi:hypothetical protein